jgi:hypothetical protein
MNYVVEMSSGAMIYFIKIGSGIEKLLWGIHRQHGDRISIILFCLIFKIRNVG